MLRIATWNVARPKLPEAPRRARLLTAMRTMQADIWVLTETYTAFSPGSEFASVTTQGADRPSEPGETWVAIWSRFPMQPVSQTSDSCRAVAVRIMPPGSRALIVYGTVLPWLGSAWQGIPAAGGAAFSAAVDAQLADWRSLQQDNPNCDFILAGDLNQDLGTAHYYGSRKNRIALQTALRTANLQCLTAAEFDPVPNHAPSHASIDHICISKGLTSVGSAVSWPVSDRPQKNLSDHFGVSVELQGI
ncbi:MAG: endonuclease/exonuclease/phosphatase family protein [Phormidesmis sp.]